MWSIDIDGTDITALCQSITWRPRLSRPASLIVRVPGHLVSVTEGVSEMHLTNGSLLFSGTVWFISDDGDPNATYTQITAYDHLIYLGKRMCKTPISYEPPDPNYIQDPDHNPGPCNLADPSLVLTQEVTAPAIMSAFMNATIACDPPAERGGPGGPWHLSVGTVSPSGPDMTGVPAEWPMNLQDFADMLLSTGWFYMIVNPGIGSSTVDLLTPPSQGGPVNDLSGSVSLDYAVGNFNSQTATKTGDMEVVTNALWYLLGPRVHWFANDISHWKGSITPTAANAGGDGQGHWEDGVLVNEPGTPWPPSLVAKWMGSQASYGYMQEIQIHDEKEDEQTDVRPLYEEMYANEALLRALPRTFAGIKPERASGSAPTFFPGDLITVNAGSKLGGGYSGAILVFEYEISIDADGVADYTDLLGSPEGG